MKIMAVIVAAEIYRRWRPMSSLFLAQIRMQIPPTPSHRLSSPVGELAEVLLRLGHLLREHVVDLRLSQVLLARHVVDLLHVQVFNMVLGLPVKSVIMNMVLMIKPMVLTMC